MTKKLRRSGAKIMASLLVLLGSLSYVMILAVINGSLGFLSAMGVTVLGAVGIAKALGDFSSVSWQLLIVLTISCGLLRGLLRYFEQYSNHYIAFKLLQVLRSKIFTALRRLAPAKLEGKQKGNIIAMITSDIETLEVFYAHTVSPILIAVLVSSAVTVFIGVISSWYMAIVALAGYLAIGVLLPMIFSKKLKISGVMYRQQFADFNGYFLDSIKGVKDIVLHNGAEQRCKEVEERSDNLLKYTGKMKSNIAFSLATTELIVTVVSVLGLAAGVWQVLAGQLTVGHMSVGLVALLGSFGPVLAVSALPGNLTQTFASGDRVLNLLEEKPVVEEIHNKNTFEFQQLQVVDVSFSYGDEDVLKGVNMSVNKGEIVGIVGASGCGKSTLLKLLMRFFKKNSGKILYNGIDIDSVDSSELLKNVTLVSQSTYLFDDTIRYNLQIAKADATDEELISACKKASVHDFIMSLPDGYDTKVGMMGDNLSAGEKQRIGLARAFLCGSELILLDEPTSNVDCINEGIILSALKQQKDKAIVLVSHRPSTMAIADKVYKFENGKVREVQS